MTHQMPQVIDCDATDCSYNVDKRCHALGITVGDEEPCCDTYHHAKKHGGFSDVIGGVGACKTDSCLFNDKLECTADGIHVKIKTDHPDCGTFMPRT